jgi:hypothetical protein
MVRAFGLESLGISKNIIWAVLQSMFTLTALCPEFCLTTICQIKLAIGKFYLAAILDITSIELALGLICNKARQSGFGQRINLLIT